MKRKHVLFLALVIGMVWMIAPACAAPAQSFDACLADYGLDMADPAVQAHVMPVNQCVTVLGVTLCVEGVYYDGQRLIIGWRTNNLQPEQLALVLYTNVRLGGISADADADFPVSQWWPHAFGLSIPGDPLNDLMDAFYRENAQEYDLQGTQEVAVSFTVTRPNQPIAVLDDEIYTLVQDGFPEADVQNMLAAMDASHIAVAPEGDTDVKEWQDNGYLVVNRGGEILNADGTTDDMPILNGEMLTDAEEADVTFTFTVDYDALIGA